MIIISTSQASRDNINSDDPQEVAMAIYTSHKDSPEALEEIYKKFGGRDVFAGKKLNSGLSDLRNALISSESFPEESFREIFDNSESIKSSDVYDWGSRAYVFENFEKFMRLWNANKSQAMYALEEFKWNVVPDTLDNGVYDSYGVWETLPMVHAEACDKDHYWCEEPRRFHPDKNLAWWTFIAGELFKVIDPKIINFIQESIFDQPVSLREYYAKSLIIKDDHWEKLRNDPKRQVLNALAENVFLPTQIAKDIVLTHKTPALREAIAKNTIDKELLELIWNSTKSKSIRETVKNNSFFEWGE